MAFTTGIAVAFPALAMEHLSMAGFFTRLLVVFAWLAYVTAIFLFVFGPQHWSTFRWVPIDGTLAVMGRGIVWLLGGLLSIGILEATNAI